MPINTHVDSIRGLRYHVVTQTLRLDEFRDTLQAVLELTGPEPEMDELWDLRDLRPDHPVLGVEELKTLVHTCDRDWAKTTTARAAIVVSRTIDYGMARMGQTLMEMKAPDRVMVFRSVRTAHRWLEDGTLPGDPWGSAYPPSFPGEGSSGTGRSGEDRGGGRRARA